MDLAATTKMPSGGSADPICLSSDSEGDGEIKRGGLSAAAKGKGRAIDTALDAEQGVEATSTENQTAYTGGADASVNGTRASTPVKPSSVAVLDALLQKLQGSSTRAELHHASSTSLWSQQGLERIYQPPAVPSPALDNPGNSLGKHLVPLATDSPIRIRVYNTYPIEYGLAFFE